jgi:predicted dehydrogenase
MNPHRIVIVGLGGMGNSHASAVADEPGCVLVGGAEVDDGNAKSWSERHGVDAIYSSYETMFDALSPDIAIIATQAPMHHAPTIAAAKRGIHIFCEKPTALNLQEADEMVAVCEENQVKFAINHIKRGSLYNQHTLSLIEEGAIGQLIRLRACDKGGRRAGNSLMEMGTHLLDWIRLFAGDVEWAHAHLTQLDGRESAASDIRNTREVHRFDRDAGLVLGERCFATFRFRNGIHADVDFLSQPETDDGAYGIDLIGTEGRIALRESVPTTMFIQEGQHQRPDTPWRRISLDGEDLDGRGVARSDESRRVLLQQRMLHDFIRAIEEDRSPFASGSDGRDCLEMIQMIWASHQQRRRVYAPLRSRKHVLEEWV